MKIWMKVLLGTLLGLALGFLLPGKDAKLVDALAFLFKLLVGAVQYALFPLVFFSGAIGVYQLKADARLGRLLLRTTLVMVAFTAGLSFFGIVSVLVASPARIPILSAGNPDSGLAQLSESFSAILPKNAFSVFFQSGDFLLPVALLALILGLTFSAERGASKQLLGIFDALSRIFYRINDLFSEFLGIAAIAFAAYGLVVVETAVDPQIYGGVLLIVFLDILIAALVVIPVALYFSCGRKNPYRVLYAMLAPSLVGLLSGNVNLSLCSLLKHQKESLGVRRRANSVCVPFVAMFGRAGTALVASVSFLIVLKSYSSLGVSVFQILWVIAASVVVSFFLGNVPGAGALAAVSILCSVFGRGFEAGYLIIKPIGFAIVAAGTFLDVLVVSSVGYIVARMEGFQDDKEIRYFI
jgi:aerobic C4-dicarboxylate transport protein